MRRNATANDLYRLSSHGELVTVSSTAADHAITRFDTLTFAIGAWLVISPAVLVYGDGDPWWSPMSCGALIALVGLACAGGLGPPALKALNIPVGAWLLSSAFWLSASSAASWSVAASGAVIGALGALAAQRRASAQAPSR